MAPWRIKSVFRKIVKVPLAPETEPRAPKTRSSVSASATSATTATGAPRCAASVKASAKVFAANATFAQRMIDARLRTIHKSVNVRWTYRIKILDDIDCSTLTRALRASSLSYCCID